MMMAKELAIYKTLDLEEVLHVLEEMVAFVESSTASGRRIDEVERGLVPHLFELGLKLLTRFVQLAGDGDQGEAVEVDGRRLKRSGTKRTKTYHSVFGILEIQRYVYAVREGQKVEFAPLDEQLALPLHEQSYVLEDWLQRLCVQAPFSEAVSTLHALFGIKTSVRCAEEMNRRMAAYIEPFQESVPVPDPESEEEIIVLSADGKGVPMVRPLRQRLREELGIKEYPWESRLNYEKTTKRRTRGDKKVRKQMAYVGAAYTIKPFVRTPDEIIEEIQRTESAEQRPSPQNKRLFAEMTQIIDGEQDEGPRRLFQKLHRECALRNGTNSKKIVCLMDGQRSLWCMQEQWLRNAIGVLDIFHVMERLWTAAYSLHPQGSVAAEAFVSKYLRMLLEGKVGYVIGVFRRMIDQHKLHGSKRKAIEQAINYLDKNRQYMKYDEYLREGYPIGSGVVEGACRHLVKDRLERSGMRWEIEGAQSMLHLRSTYLNGDWDAFIKYRAEAEQTARFQRAA